MAFHFYDNLFFTTSTIHKWIKVLTHNQANQIIYETWKFLHQEKRCIIYCYVIMPNHIHWIYHVLPPYRNDQIKHSFLSYTSKRILEIQDIKNERFIVNKADRKMQIWKENSLSVSINSDKFLVQKMNYIHNNPTVADLVKAPELYKHSSYPHYIEASIKPDFLTLW